MKPSIVVIGSSNTDMVMQLPALPVPGETLLNGSFATHPGGKGANQAVAAARCGGEVTFIACVGDDDLGKQSIKNFKQDGIHTHAIYSVDKTASGVALILVGDQGKNMIGVASGANAALQPHHIDEQSEVISNAQCVLMQLETPLDTIEHAAKFAKSKGVTVILNPAPAQTLPVSLLKNIDIITPNETEAEHLTGIPVIDSTSAKQAAHHLREQGIGTVIITLGSQGAYVFDDEHDELIAPMAVDAVDSTAAGDTFNGALAVAIGQGWPIKKAIQFANVAGALSVTKAGAQPSIPTLEACQAYL